ncbi:hypothetical protein C8F04DRAFT_41119 [Mycena alexandri]|uniref:SWIM-type domain-containing protein n=1 Tax=Mycena alexandri TaxID=1745969 RepID=A0AAD6WYL9_9AGAR|nr:hypothetical protein C8F04DRAFT_41119 [Mycena alexandri]
MSRCKREKQEGYQGSRRRRQSGPRQQHRPQEAKGFAWPRRRQTHEPSTGRHNCVHTRVQGAGGTKAATSRLRPEEPTQLHVGECKENAGGDTSDGVRTRVGRTVRPTRNPDAADPEELAAAMKARGPATAPATAPKRATATAANTQKADDVGGSEEEEEEVQDKTRRTFCPAVYRDPILTMMERHYCAHPLLPGNSHPSPEGIKRWAVSQMYKFCVEHDLREVWAYLWENWYRKSRWELWSRSVYPEIPILKTTMILESHWRRIKHDFLHHFHMPRCDLLAWILIVKLAPTYYRKLERLLTDTGRYRELPSWRKDFKKIWRRNEKTPITLPVNPAYKTDATKGLCTCRSMPTSRFLVCKHYVQAVERVPPVFFLEVKRHRTPPFWRHQSLRPLGQDSAADTNSDDMAVDALPGSDDAPPGSDDDDDDLVDTRPDEGDRWTFVESMDENIDVIMEFARGLKFQKQFRDQRMLETVEKEGASFLRLARACLRKEKRLASTRGSVPSTWDKSAGSAMYYRARPAASQT